jgi:hypothetical protein
MLCLIEGERSLGIEVLKCGRWEEWEVVVERFLFDDVLWW